MPLGAGDEHGEQLAALIAPDLAFNDIEDKYLIIKQKLCIESLLGRGSFGSVYCGSLDFYNNNHNSNSNAKESRGSGGRQSARDDVECERYGRGGAHISQNQPDSKPKLCAKSGRSAMAGAAAVAVNDEQKKAFNKNYNFGKNIRWSAKAYVVARQEIAIISSLRHEHIVTMIGLIIQPLAIILELATLGNFKDKLGEYKKHVQAQSAHCAARVHARHSSIS